MKTKKFNLGDIVRDDNSSTTGEIIIIAQNRESKTYHYGYGDPDNGYTIKHYHKEYESHYVFTFDGEMGVSEEKVFFHDEKELVLLTPVNPLISVEQQIRKEIWQSKRNINQENTLLLSLHITDIK